MAERWILNASPLIVLANIGQTALLTAQADEIIIPRAVAEEIQAGPVEDKARQAIETGQFNIQETPPPPPELQAWDLGSGETSVISQALSIPGWTAILDDAAARKCARSFGVTVKGTLAVVILAKKRGFISSATDVLRSLRTIGFRLDDKTIREALLRTTGETWDP